MGLASEVHAHPRILTALCLAVGMVVPSPAQNRKGEAHAAQRAAHPPKPGKAPKTPIDEFETMPPEQQRQALDRLPPAQRQQLEERLRRFNHLPAEQQRALKGLYNRLHQLPPQRQDAVRKAINQFSEQKPDRQQAIREELRGLASLPQQERDARFASLEFRDRFSPKERGIVRDMSDLVGGGQ
jgi:hypothetical protein